MCSIQVYVIITHAIYLLRGLSLAPVDITGVQAVGLVLIVATLVSGCLVAVHVL